MADIPAVSLGGTTFYEDVFNELNKDRVILLNDDINADIIEKAIIQIIKWNKEDQDIEINKRKPIRIYISSCGGEVFVGMTLIDTIRNSKTKIKGFVLDCAYSMAGIIFAVCHERYMLESSSLLIHDGNMIIAGTANKAKDMQKFYNKVDEKIKNFIIEHSKITIEEYDANADRELYMFADECKEKGLCDKIIGIDCGFEEIF